MTLSIRLRDMPAQTALLAGVSRINHHHRHTCKPGLVLDKEAQLCKGPAAHSGALRLPELRPTAEVLEIFQGQPALGACSSRNERFTDAMVHVSTKARFSAARPLQRTSNVLRALGVHLRHMRGTLQSLTALRIARATGFNTCSAVCRAVRCCRQIDDANIHPR